MTNKPIGTCCIGTEGPDGGWGVRDFYCTVATDNIASCRVMEKCGLKPEATGSFKNHNTGVEHESTIYKMKLK